MRHLHRRDPRCTCQYCCVDDSSDSRWPWRNKKIAGGRPRTLASVDDQCQTFHVIGSHGAHLRADVARTAHNAAQTSSRVLRVPRRSRPTVGERGPWRGVAARTRAPWTVPTRSPCEPRSRVADTRLPGDVACAACVNNISPKSSATSIHGSRRAHRASAVLIRPQCNHLGALGELKVTTLPRAIKRESGPGIGLRVPKAADPSRVMLRGAVTVTVFLDTRPRRPQRGACPGSLPCDLVTSRGYSL